MKPLGLVVGVAVLVAATPSLSGKGSGGFDQKLSKDKQAVHVLNRLTYGPRPGDADEVRRLGVEKWIMRQLRPQEVPVSPMLDAKLEPSASLQLTSRQMYEKYGTGQGAVFRVVGQGQVLSMLGHQAVPQDVLRKLANATPDDRRAILDGLSAEQRRRVLANIPAAQLM